MSARRRRWPGPRCRRSLRRSGTPVDSDKRADLDHGTIPVIRPPSRSNSPATIWARSLTVVKRVPSALTSRAEKPPKSASGTRHVYESMNCARPVGSADTPSVSKSRKRRTSATRGRAALTGQVVQREFASGLRRGALGSADAAAAGSGCCSPIAAPRRSHRPAGGGVLLDAARRAARAVQADVEMVVMPVPGPDLAQPAPVAASRPCTSAPWRPAKTKMRATRGSLAAALMIS